MLEDRRDLASEQAWAIHNEERRLRCCVYPAAGFPEYAKRRGAGLVILNREETPLDSFADLVLHREIGSTMSYVTGFN